MKIQLVAPYIVMLVARSAECSSIEAVELVVLYMVMLVAPCMRTDLFPVCFVSDPDSRAEQYARYKNPPDCGIAHSMLAASEREVVISSPEDNSARDRRHRSVDSRSARFLGLPDVDIWREWAVEHCRVWCCSKFEMSQQAVQHYYLSHGWHAVQHYQKSTPWLSTGTAQVTT